MELDWDLVDEVLKNHIEIKQNYISGFYEIRNIVKSETEIDLLVNIDESRMQDEFEEWVKFVLSKQKIPSKIKSIYFGLFTMVDPEINEGKETTTIHLMGSTFTPIEDEDWASDPEFTPENRYMVLTDFIAIDNNVKQRRTTDGALNVLIYNGILNLLLINSIKNLIPLFLGNHKSIYIGCGYDEGDPYVIGKLSNSGLK
jgi:hypothetical protein